MNKLLLAVSFLLTAFALSAKDVELDYPNSPYADEATHKADRMEFIRETKPGDWKSYKRYIDNNGAYNSKTSAARDSLYNYCKKHQTLEAIDYAIRNLSDSDRKRFLVLMHGIYANASVSTEDNDDNSISGFVANLSKFYEDYGAYGANNLDSKSKDAYLVENYNNMSLNEVIHKSAPYSFSLQLLTIALSDKIKNKEWHAVLDILNSYADDFGDDVDFNKLKKTISAQSDPSVKVYAMGKNINAPEGSAYSPCISANSKTLLFCGKDRNDNIGGEDIFISHLKNEGWTKSVAMTDLCSEYYNESPKGMSADGTKILLFISGRLYESQKTKAGWTEPEELSANINIAEWQSDAMITSDGKAMLFAARAKSDHEINESINIFVSTLGEDGNWSEPVDLGPTVNTAFKERSPFLHPDMKTLYFASEGHGSLGGFDVYKTTRLYDDSWTDWSEPENLGKDVNTVGSDWGYKISTDGKTAFFSKELESGEKIHYLDLPKSMRPQPVATISGKLQDSDGNPIQTSIDWEDLETHQQVGQSETDPEDGSYFIVLPEGKNYGYYVNDTTYFPVANNIDLRGKDVNMQIEHPIEVVSIEKMTENSIPMTLNNLFFNTDEYVLLPASINELQRVAALIKKVGRKVEISGHTDDVGTAEYNKELSEKRAGAVRDYLIGQGISADLLVAKGYGKSKPVTNSKTVAGRQKNRRVEMRFLK